jgi:hypothetical protein
MSERNLEVIMGEVRMASDFIRHLYKDIDSLDPTHENDALVPSALRETMERGLATLQKLTNEAATEYYDR